MPCLQTGLLSCPAHWEEPTILREPDLPESEVNPSPSPPPLSTSVCLHIHDVRTCVFIVIHISPEGSVSLESPSQNLPHSSRADRPSHGHLVGWGPCCPLLPSLPCPPPALPYPELQLITCPRKGWDQVTGLQPPPRSPRPQPEGGPYAHPTGLPRATFLGATRGPDGSAGRSSSSWETGCSLVKTACPSTPTLRRALATWRCPVALGVTSLVSQPVHRNSGEQGIALVPEKSSPGPPRPM